MISKELLSKVLNFPFTSITNIQSGNNLIAYTTYELPTHKYKFINIYELAYMCKEWAYKQDWEYIINTHKTINGKLYRVWFEKDTETEFFADTEPEAIFKACEWILTQKDTK